MLLTTDKEKLSQRKKASPTDRPIRELKPQADEGELTKYQHLAMISFFSKSSLAYDSTLDDNKLMILHLLPQSWFWGAWISEDGGEDYKEEENSPQQEKEGAHRFQRQHFNAARCRSGQ